MARIEHVCDKRCHGVEGAETLQRSIEIESDEKFREIVLKSKDGKLRIHSLARSKKSGVLFVMTVSETVPIQPQLFQQDLL